MASISESDRAKLFMALAKALGNDQAETMSTALNLDGQLASRDELRTEIFAVREDMRDEFAAVRMEMRDEFAAVRMEMREGFDRVDGETRSLHSEIADVREKIASGNRNLLFQLLAMQMTMFGLVVAAVKLLS
jgi:hypothetical protein